MRPVHSGARPVRAASLLAACAVFGSAQAAPAHDAHAAGLVRRTLEAGALGRCPAALMQPVLRRKCLEQMPGAGADLARLGRIVRIEDIGGREDPRLGAVELYRVRFSRGRMTWMARPGRDGRLAVLETID
jgi:hypothetical protein